MMVQTCLSSQCFGFLVPEYEVSDVSTSELQVHSWFFRKYSWWRKSLHQRQRIKWVMGFWQKIAPRQFRRVKMLQVTSVIWLIFFFFAWNVSKDSGRPLPAVVKGVFFLKIPPTYPWKIPQTLHQQFMNQFLSLLGFGEVWGIFPGYVGKIIEFLYVFVVLNFRPPVDIFQLSPWGWVIVIWADRLEGGFCHNFTAFFWLAPGIRWRSAS